MSPLYVEVGYESMFCHIRYFYSSKLLTHVAISFYCTTLFVLLRLYVCHYRMSPHGSGHKLVGLPYSYPAVAI